MSFRLVVLLLALPSLVAGSASAQQIPLDDVVLLGRAHGARPPQAYFDTKARDPDAFTFSRAWKARNPRLRRMVTPGLDGRPRFEAVRRDDSGTFDRLAALGPREGAVTGTIRVPLVLGLFSDSPDAPPFTRARIQQEFFDGPNSRYKTITEYYREVSGGRVELLGETRDWVRTSLTEEQVTGGVSALGGPGRIGEYIIQILSAHPDVDWGRYDNDGPDGEPNSGDDDGYVDILTVMHPNFGAECGGSGQDDRIWSHKWDLRSATGQLYVTGVSSASGGRIRINDYTVQPVYSCSEAVGGRPINEIGVLAHELGHGLGLPDLYAVGSNHSGIGQWGLMGSGSWGCSPGWYSHPCHMSAWSKEQLGWVDVVTLSPGVDLETVTLQPVETSGTVYRIDAQDGSGEYFLLENRQKLGFDEYLLEPGLLVWHVDDAVVSSKWGINKVNSDGAHMGVHLRQADGRNDLGTSGASGGNRGDDGDPFPGRAVRRAFHAGSTPGALTWGGEASGLTLTDIVRSGSNVTARVLTRFQTVTLQASGAGTGSTGFAVDGVAMSAPTRVTAAPFQVLSIEAGAGGEISDGIREGFLGWADDSSLGRARSFVTPTEDVALTATYGGEEVRARLAIEGQQFGVPPGTVEMTPAARDEGGELWFARGTSVTFEAVPNTGYGFGGWTGPMAGMGNPATFTLDAPADLGVLFELTYGVPGATHTLEAARAQEIVLVAENATTPVTWLPVGGSLPRGLALESGGRITGAALETGTFTLDLRARDANGLEATGGIVLEVHEPVLGVDALIAPFIQASGSLTVLERSYLDAQGNGDGVYDLGDFRAWVLAHPDLPASAEERALVRTLIPVVRFQPGGGR